LIAFQRSVRDIRFIVTQETEVRGKSGSRIAEADSSGDRVKKAVKPRHRRRLARWAQEAYRIPERRAARILGMSWSTMRYRSRRPLQEALRGRLRDLAATHVRYGYRRLTVLLRREGWPVNAKRIYRLYDEENLKVRSVERKKIGRRQRIAQSPATGPNQCWAADFVSDKLTDGPSYRILTIIDQFTRECIGLVADRSMCGSHVVSALTQAVEERGGVPRSITLDNGSEFAGRVLEAWAIQHDVQLCFIRPGRPVENGFIESFNGRLRDECLNVEWFGSLHEARKTLARWRTNYNHYRPHSALADQTPSSFASQYAKSAERFAPMHPSRASEEPRQGFAAPADAALDPVPCLPEDIHYRSEALFRIAHTRDSLLSIWSELQARKISSGGP
jgi:putative transposase